MAFAQDLKAGQELETLVAKLLTEKKVKYSEVTDMTEQHKGDFLLTNSGIYIECKLDRRAFKSHERHTPNLYFESAKIYDETIKGNRSETVEITGALKNAAKAPVIFVHQVDEDQFIVYTAESIANHWLKGAKSGFFWNEFQDRDYTGKQMIGFLWKNWRKDLKSGFVITDSENLVRVIGNFVRNEKINVIEETVFLEIIDSYNKQWSWKEKGYLNYKFIMSGKEIFISSDWNRQNNSAEHQMWCECDDCFTF